MRRIVAKFGGASVGDRIRVRSAAKSVYREYRKGAQVAVVVSAMGHTTDNLIRAARASTGGRISRKEMDNVMSLGERFSVRVFASALCNLGADAQYIDPGCPEWPVVTDSNFGNARVDLVETRRRVRKFILPILKRGTIPVICGFLGKDRRGNITTFGRGGSDITAFLMASCLGADEVILVKDVDGVMSGDPSRTRAPSLIPKITVEEIRDLARYGAQVLHPRAVDYKIPSIDAKVIHFRHGSLSARGTTIVGPGGGRTGVRLYKNQLAMLTIVGSRMQLVSGILAKTTVPLGRAGVNIFGVSIGPRSFSIYVARKDASRAIRLLHEVVKRHKLMKSVTSEEDIAMVIAESERFIDTPGIIARLAEPLARKGINIVEIFSSRASITFFVRWADSRRALKILRQTMREVYS